VNEIMANRCKIAFLLLSLALAGCMSDGIAPQPGFALPPPPAASLEPAAANGAIYQPGRGYAALHMGQRARRIGDIVTVVLVENIASSKSTSSQTQRDGSASITPPGAGPLSFLDPAALKAASEASFKGSGTAAQRSTLNGAIAVTIVQTMSNDTARIMGERHMGLSQGSEFVQFSGLIRLADVNSDNRVLSSQVADAQIVYSGRGAVQRASKPGWLSTFFAKISPF
jgi:flagellar L-ring protein FlgH